MPVFRLLFPKFIFKMLRKNMKKDIFSMKFPSDSMLCFEQNFALNLSFSACGIVAINLALEDQAVQECFNKH
mgnify:CR=1 FL=1